MNSAKWSLVKVIPEETDASVIQAIGQQLIDQENSLQLTIPALTLSEFRSYVFQMQYTNFYGKTTTSIFNEATTLSGCTDS